MTAQTGTSTFSTSLPLWLSAPIAVDAKSGLYWYETTELSALVTSAQLLALQAASAALVPEDYLAWMSSQET
jgi:hypothetical protein